VAFLARDAAAARQAAPAVNDSLLAPVLTVSDSAALKGPRQPIFFRHDIHAGQFKINCQYCHYSVSVSSEPGIPSMATCMNCHLVIGGTDSTAQREIAKVRDAFNTNTPVEWSRVYFLARHAHFPHMRHINAMGPNACATCHGDVTRTPQVFKVNNVNNMGFCINCHLERNVSRDCSVCHY
jgi:hypothetical protein